MEMRSRPRPQLDLGDDGTVFIGFTAATGGLNESHEVGAWSIAAAPAP